MAQQREEPISNQKVAELPAELWGELEELQSLRKFRGLLAAEWPCVEWDRCELLLAEQFTEGAPTEERSIYAPWSYHVLEAVVRHCSQYRERKTYEDINPWEWSKLINRIMDNWDDRYPLIAESQGYIREVLATWMREAVPDYIHTRQYEEPNPEYTEYLRRLGAEEARRVCRDLERLPTLPPENRTNSTVESASVVDRELAQTVAAAPQTNTESACILSLGKGCYRIGQSRPLKVSDHEDTLLQAFLKTPAMDRPDLEDLLGMDFGPATVKILKAF